VRPSKSIFTHKCGIYRIYFWIGNCYEYAVFITW